MNLSILWDCVCEAVFQLWTAGDCFTFFVPKADVFPAGWPYPWKVHVLDNTLLSDQRFLYPAG